MSELLTHGRGGQMNVGLGPVQRAIVGRRSNRRFAEAPVPRDVLARLLDAAVQAPNHHLTRPWRFFVVDRPGAVRQRIADLAADGFRTAMQPTLPAERLDQGANNKRDELLRVPALVLCFSVPGGSDAETRENYAACACAMQNLMLAATEEGLSTGWSTGGITQDPALRSIIGADTSWEMVGALYVGYPSAELTPASPRPGAAEFTRWLSDVSDR